MLLRALKSRILIRNFSGGHDPYWLHLEQSHDNYPQYAHLHWHTVELHEINKYAQWRSKEKFGDHVSEDPTPIEWYSDLGQLKTLNKRSRDIVYDIYTKHEGDFLEFLEENIDYAHQGDHTLLDGARDAALSVYEPEQIHSAIQVAIQLIEEYKQAGIPFSRQCIKEKINLVLLKSLSKHQAHELSENLDAYLAYFGLSLPVFED